METTSTGGPLKTAWDPGTNDRREALRRNVVDSHLVTVDLAFQSGALLLDLSETGMGVQALSSAPIGNTTSLRFDLPETGGRVDAIGRIAWTDSSGRLGIRFEEIAEPSRVHLAQWLARERRPPVIANGSMPSWPPAHMRDEIAALRRDLVTQKLEGDEALAFIVERTRSVTRATGAAVALEESGAIECRASSGNAPGIGAHLDPNSGLSGECVRSGEIVRCEDTETDPRADRLVCRKLELRSIVIVPIRIHGRPSGVLEAFSSRAHAFQNSDVLLLRRVADLVAGIAACQPELAHPTPAGPHAIMATTVLEPPLEPEPNVQPESESELRLAPLMMDDILALDFLDSRSRQPMPSAEEAVTAPPAPITARPQPPAQPEATNSAQPTAVVEPPAEKPKEIKQVAPVAEERVAAVPIVPKFDLAALVAKFEVEPAAAAPAVVPAPPRRPEMAREAVSVPGERPAVPAFKKPEVASPAARSFAAASMASVLDQPVKSGLSARAATSAAPAVAPLRPKPAPVDENDGRPLKEFGAREAVLPSLAAQAPSQWKNMRVTGAAILAGVLVIGGWQVWRVFAPVKGTPMDSELKKNQPGPAPSTSEATNPSPPVVPVSATPPAAPATTTPAPAAKPPAKTSTPATMPDEVTTRAVSPAPLAKKTPEPVNTPPASEASRIEEPPVIGFISRPVVESSAISNMLHTPVAAPSLDRPTAVSQISGGKLIQRVEPVYPRSSLGLYGEVTLKAVVGKEGNVKSVKIVKGQSILAQAAAAAVRRWRYQPFVLNGVPIEVENTIVVTFKAPGSN
jgi:TonB family protein